MKPHRILFITTNDFGFGGSEDLWVETARVLLRQGYVVAASVRKWAPLPVVLNELIADGCEMLWHQNPPSVNEFADTVDFRPTLVVVSQGYQLEGISWLAELRRQRIPFILVAHCVHETGWPSISEADMSYITALHDAARKHYFVSEGNRRLHEKFFGHASRAAAIVRNPYKVRFQPDLAWPRHAPLRFATVGRLECFHKGYDLLMEAFAAPDWAGRNWELHLYGDGQHRSLLERLAPSAVRNRIHFHGHVSDLEAVWAENHVLVQPSRLEGMPISIVEAMLCGRPVLATDVAGHREWIEHGVSGFIAEAATPRHVGQALELLWAKRAHLREMGDAARATAQKLAPVDPAGTFAAQVLAHADDAAQDTTAIDIDRTSVRADPPPTGSTSDQFAHLYYTRGIGFAEERKAATYYPANQPVTLVFSGLHGEIRFDPGDRPGTILVSQTTLVRLDSQETVFDEHGAGVAALWRVDGTAEVGGGSGDAGLIVASTGCDPIMHLTGWNGAPTIPVRLTVKLTAR